MEKSILHKKCCTTHFFLRMMKTMTKSFLFVKKRSLLLVFFIAISFCSTVFAQDPCLPATEFDIINPVVHDPNCDIGNGDCTSKDLYVLDAYLDTGDPCNSCDEGETITAGLYLTLVNDTGSTRTSFAIFGSVETTDKNGVVTTCSISRCSGPIPGNTTAALYYGDVEFKCGDSLSLVDLIQSWTDASPNSNCANHDCKEISPKCGFSDAIVITPPLQATTKAVCTSATTINIDLTVQGGVAPFTYAWTKVGDGGFSESTEDLTGVSAGTYNVTVTDANTCTTMTSITPEICCTDANAGSDGDTTVCDSRTDAIDLFGLITGEDPSGTWTRLTGSGGTFNAGLGTFTPSSEATNSTFKYTLSASPPCSGDESVATVNIEDAKDPGEDGLLTICSSEDLTEGMLFAALGGSPDVGGIWSPALSGSGVYTYTIVGTEYCPEVSAKVTVSIEDAKDPGEDGLLTICSSEDLTEGMLFAALGGSPDVGGIWSPALSGSGVYTYTIAGTEYCPEVSAKVTVSIEDAKDPGEDGLLTICSSEDLTEGMLFAALGGSPDVGGIWSPALSGSGVYTYTIVGTEYCPEVSAKVTVSIEDAKDPGEDGLLTICSSEDLTEGMLFAVLGGSPDVGGIWSPALSGSGVYTYTIVGTEYCPEVSAKVTVSIEDAKDPGEDGLLTICSSEDLTEGMLFAVLGGSPDVGGIWSPALSGSGVYTYTIAGTEYCPEVSAKVTVSIEDAKDPGTNGTLTICFGETVTASELFDSLNSNPEAGGVWSPLPLGGAGTYTYTFAATNICPEVSADVVVTEQSEITSSTEAFHVSCFGESDGKIILTASGGAPPYTYLWSNGAKTKDISDLSAGLYSVKITDSRGCIDENSARINQPDKLVAELVCGHLTCHSDTNGTLDLTVTGGTPPYTYLWSNGETVEDPVGLPGGIYSVVVTDANGCTVTQYTVISQPDLLVCNIVQDSPCGSNGGSDGVATVTAEGGEAPYTYLWDNGETTATAVNLTAGLHTVTVTDSLDCETTCEIIITEPEELVCSVELNNHVLCKGDSTGSATVTASDGVTPYTYLWDNGEVTQTAIGLNAGLHSVTVTDANDQITTCTIMITEPDMLETSAIGSAVIGCGCYGNSDGSIDLTVSGGTSPYTYLWNNGETTEDLSGLSAGVYDVVVTDSNGCIATEEVVIEEPDMLSCETVEDSPVSVHGGSDGVATVTPSGGTAPYEYLWSPGGATTAQATGLSAGMYTVTVTDSSGCETTCDVVITEPNPDSARAFCSYTQGFYGNPGGLACIPDSQKVNAKYIMLGALNASGGQVDFGDKNTNKYFRLFLGDIQNDNIFKLLPGGGPSKSLLGYATYNDNTTWSNVPLVDKGPRRGAIKNNLLSQTMTLYFNLHADKSLSSYQLEETFYTASTLDCGSEEYDETSIQMFKISSDVISYLELNDMATVQGLFELANRALGGNDIGSLSCSSITDAVDTINNGFDECRVLLPESVYDSVVQGLDNDKPIFSAYPIPFIDTINIRYEIDGATEATIQVFDLQGRLVKSIVDKDIYYHKVKTLDLDYKIFANQMYFIKVNTNNRSTLLKIISVK